jgi:hypothetical protein
MAPAMSRIMAVSILQISAVFVSTRLWRLAVAGVLLGAAARLLCQPWSAGVAERG